MKTLTELNSKWYWRFIKVIYFLILFLIISFSIYNIWSNVDKIYKVTFENGVAVEFENHPTMKDIDSTWDLLQTNNNSRVFTPLTKEQYQKAINNWFSPERILELEKIRKSRLKWEANNPEATLKKLIILKYPDWIANDGRKYSEIPANELVIKLRERYPDGIMTDNIKYDNILLEVLSREQIQENITALEKYWMTPEDIQAYIDTYKKGKDDVFYQTQYTESKHNFFSPYSKYIKPLIHSILLVLVFALFTFMLRSGVYYIMFGKVFPPK